MGASGLVRAVSALSVTQILGWGTTFYLPAVFAPAMAAGTGVPVQFVFGGVTLMLFVGAFTAPAFGRGFARWGTRPFMAAGSVLVGLALFLLGRAEGPVLFAIAWMLLGLAMPAALGQAASAAMVQIAPGRARGAITVLLLFSGMTSTACWPALIWLDGRVGWRDSLTIFAILHLLVAAPLHWFGLPLASVGKPPERDERDDAPEPPAAAPVPVPGAFWLTAATFSLVGFVTWGVPLQLILILRDYGHSDASAIWIGALFGPGQVLSRVFELVGGYRLPIMATGLLAVGLVPVSLGLFLVWGASSAGALAFVLLYGFAAGLTSIARAIVPLRLFGAGAYAAMSGRLALPQNLAFGSAPLCLAAIREASGAAAMMTTVMAVALASLLAMALLALRVAQADQAARQSFSRDA